MPKLILEMEVPQEIMDRIQKDIRTQRSDGYFPDENRECGRFIIDESYFQRFEHDDSFFVFNRLLKITN